MRTIAIINQKGGCGKTTTAINLAAVMAGKGRRTLLVDMDPQSHCALGLAVPDTQLERSTADLLRNGLNGTVGVSEILWQISRNLDLAPSAMALAGIEMELATAPDKDRRLAQVLSPVQDQYDFCIVDCPPSIGLLTFNALRASAEVIIPVETGYFSMQGAVRQQATIEMMARRVNHRCRFSVLATMYDVRTKLARELLSELRRHFGEMLLPIVIHFNAKLKEAASFGQAITEYDPGSRGYMDFEELADWLIANPPVFADAGEGEAGGASAPGVGAPASAASNPAMSRALELVERARVLTQRTAALSARLSRDPDVVAETDTPVLPSRAGPSAPTGPQPPIPVPPVLFENSPGGGTLVLERPATATVAPQTLADKLARFYGARGTAQGILFVQPINGFATACIAGDFNQWKPETTPMRRDDTLGVWQACIPVPPGRYRYRLVIDGRWTQDPYNTYVESNPFGELNNVVEIGIDG